MQANKQAACAKVGAIVDRAPSNAAAIEALFQHAVGLHLELGQAQAAVAAADAKVMELESTVSTLRVKLAALLDKGAQGMADQSVEGMVGKGFSCARTLRLHAAEWEGKVLSKYGDNVKKARQMVDNLARRFRTKYPGPLTQGGQAHAVLESARDWFGEMRAQHDGRFPNAARAAYRAAHQLLSHSGLPDTVVERLTGADRKILAQERLRFDRWVHGDEETLIDFRGALRSDKLPGEWIDFCVDTWVSDDCTRPGEAKDDRDRNPLNHSEHHRRRYLDVQIKDVVRMVQEGGKAKFISGFKYSDGKERKEGFHMDHKVISALRPYYVKDNTRDTCLCWRCEQWNRAAEALFHVRTRTKRVAAPAQVAGEEKKDTCGCANPKTGKKLMRHVMCVQQGPRDKAGRPPLPARSCVNSSCDKCKGVAGLFGAGGLVCAEEQTAMEDETAKWDKYKDIKYVTKAGEEKKVKDFVSVQTAAAELTAKLGEIESDMREHSDHAFWCARDKKYKRNHVPRGFVHSTQDFSENGKLTARREIQSAYFHEVGYTLYGVIIERRIEDLTDVSDEEKARLLKLMEENGRPPQIIETHIIVSDDLAHDNAAVQHFNDNIITPHLKKTTAGCLFHLVTSDGCCCQYKCANHFLWLSKQQQMHTIKMGWTVGCPAHNKDLSDAECGGGKNEVDRANMMHVSGDAERHYQITLPKDAAQHLKDHYSKPKKTIFEKKGRGVYRRFIHWHDSKADPINRRLPTTKTMDGSSEMFEFIDIGVPGKLMVRRRPCHQCECCMRLDPSGCVNKLVCGEPEVWEVPTLAPPRLPTTRRGLEELGKKISKESEAGDYVIVEVSNMHSERFMVGQVVKGGEARELEEGEEEDTWFGMFSAGDYVLRVTKLEPLAPGSVTFENRDEQNRRDTAMLVYAEDVRMGLRDWHYDESMPVHRATRLNPAHPRITLKPDAHNTILQLISPVAANPDDPHHLIGLEYKDESSADAMKVEGFVNVTEGQRVFRVRNVTKGGFENMVEEYLRTKVPEE